ncbi:hypothetical protein KOW79_020818 [Hemibagrus wyckioides]|uniref:Uncharacterized protein n=1 Tax=Hemibagrus wyckioides TaxID=337641 RepID=A0A9D3S9R3_9TELE|nr:hypothetical protein KOW79_020818 [Hemibagrus wyckioides]
MQSLISPVTKAILVALFIFAILLILYVILWISQVFFSIRCDSFKTPGLRITVPCHGEAEGKALFPECHSDSRGSAVAPAPCTVWEFDFQLHPAASSPWGFLPAV